MSDLSPSPSAAGDSENTYDRGIRGRMFATYTVECGVCYEWTLPSGGSHRLRAASAHEMGWRLTKERGWLCPEHAAQDSRTALGLDGEDER